MVSTGLSRNCLIGELQSPEGHITGATGAGYVLSAKANNSFIAVNDLLASGVDVYRLPNGPGGKSTVEAGAFFVPASAKAKSLLDKSAKDLGLEITGLAKKPTASMTKVSPCGLPCGIPTVARCHRAGCVG